MVIKLKICMRIKKIVKVVNNLNTKNPDVCIYKYVNVCDIHFLKDKN